MTQNNNPQSESELSGDTGDLILRHKLYDILRHPHLKLPSNHVRVIRSGAHPIRLERVDIPLRKGDDGYYRAVR